MASDDLDIPQIAVFGIPADNNPETPAEALSSRSSDSPRLPPSLLGHATSPTDNQNFLSLPTPILKSARNSLDAIGSPSSHASDTSSLQPPLFPTLFTHSAGSNRCNSRVLRDNNPEGQDGLSPPPHRHRKEGVTTVSSVGSTSTEWRDEDNQRFRLNPVRLAHPDATSTLPSRIHTHFDVISEVPSCPSSPASFHRKTLHRVRWSSPPPSGETDTGSETTRNDGREDNSYVKRKEPERTRPAVLDFKQETDFDIHLFEFKPLQLASLVDSKSLETLENMGGVDAILRGLRTQPTYGLGTKLAPLPSHGGSSDRTSHELNESHAPNQGPPKPNIMVTSPAGVPQGFQSTVCLAGGSGVSPSTAFVSSEDVHRTSIEDRKRIFGLNIVPRRPSKILVQLMWLALKDKILVRRIYSTYSNV
jgi:Ca2+-transporting ATPase